VSSDGRAKAPDLDDRVVRTALTSMPFASVLLVDGDLRYRAAVGAAIAFYGYDTQDMTGRHVSEVVTPETNAHVEPALRRALGGESFMEVHESPALDATFEMTYGPAIEDGEIVGALVVVRDVTGEHRALNELAASDRLYQMLMSQTSDVIALTTVEDARYTWVSASAARVLGWKANELVGRIAYDFIHPDDALLVKAKRTALVNGAEQASATYRYRRPGGGWIWVEGQVRAVHDADGAITGLVTTARDVSDRKRLEAELARARQLFESAFAAAPIGMALVSIDGRFIKVNNAVCTLLQRDEASLLRVGFQDLTHPEDLAGSVELLKGILDGTSPDGRMEKRFVRPDGSVVWCLLALALVRDDDDRPRFFISQTQDITERRNAQREMERLATIDALTGLPNRLLLMDRLRHALSLARRSGWQVGVVFVDLDRFKDVNDTFGHDVGDELLRQVAVRLEGATRVGDTTTRLGGDEFVVLCEQVTAAAEVAQVAERIRVALARSFDVLGYEIPITASVGVTVGDSESGETLLQEADRSMYAAKRGGRGRIDVYSEARGTIAVDQLAVHAALAKGITRGELRVFFQPIVDLQRGGVTAQEALVRWAHPTRGLLGPSAFLSGADRSPLGVALGEQVLQLACSAAATWPDGYAVHVNVSARHLAEPGFVAFVQRCMAASGLAPTRLVLEITESLVLAASRSTLTSTTALADLGVGLCLDDFGTGYSSVTALHKLPIGGFKIDRSFVAGIPHNPTSASLVDGLISLGTGMGIDVVAEGVETHEQALWLAAHGCAHGQGFLFGRPVESPS
jgi:diguanylate cyclase (GGDEF)-like protein/PAS domain S-box-containing protein